MRVLTPLRLAASVAVFSPGAAVLAAEGTAAQSHAVAARMVDADFAADTAAGGVAEIEMAKLAKEKSTNKAVTAFADQVIADHGAVNAQLKQVAAKLDWVLPTDMGPQHRETYANIKKLSGERFEAAYRLAMVSDHSKTVAAFQQHAEYGKAPELKAFAEMMLPKLQHHLEMAQALPGGD